MGKFKVLKWGLVAGLLGGVAFIAGCVPAEENGGEGTSPVYMIVFLVLIFGLFYFLMIRPQQKRQKEQQQLMSELQRGDRVITTGGIYGQIESVSEDSVVLKVESGTTIRVARSGIAGKRAK